jgi:hypothetical protein
MLQIPRATQADGVRPHARAAPGVPRQWGLTPSAKSPGLGEDVGSDPVSGGYNPIEVLR